MRPGKSQTMNERQHIFSILNNYFDHIYVITLPRATDRQAHIRQELEGLHYSFFFGKDKQNFPIEELKAQGIYEETLARQHHRYGKAMNAGQVCVSWSHAEVYRDVVKNNYRKVFIMEDDVVLDANAAKNLSAILQEFPADWEFVYFGFAEREKAPAGVFFKKLFYHFLRLFKAIPFSHATISHLYPKKVSAHIYQAGYHDCIHAYAITRAAAEKLLRLQEPISFIADNLTAHAVTNKIVNGYVVLPKIFYQQYQVGTSATSYLNDRV